MSDGDVIDTAQAISNAVHAVAARMGLQQPIEKASEKNVVRLKRKSAPTRAGPLWSSVKIIQDHATSPRVECVNCTKTFCGGASRIEKHICDDCDCDTEIFLALKEKVAAKRVDKVEEKESKASVKEVNAAATGESAEKKVKLEKPGGQIKITSVMNSAAAADVDSAIAECFYALNIKPNVANAPLFKAMVNKIKTTPP
eukprot:1467315-Prymnesium_polylepis.1